MGAPTAREAYSRSGPESEIPDKLYFKIGEVSLLVGVQAHVLRYWEREVPCIRPGKSASNQRRYRRKDVEIFREIRRLLYEERYTLAGARKRLTSGDRELAPPSPPQLPSRPGPPSPPVRMEIPLSAAPAVRPAPAFNPENLQRARDGLRDLIRFAGEEP